MSHDPPSPTSGRLVALDTLRTLTISYVLLYHVAQVSARGGLSAAPADDAPRLLGPLILATGLWRMPLMFLIAGASTELFLRRRTWREFVAVRVRRLIVPAAFALAVVVPVLRYADAHGHEPPLAFAAHAWSYLTTPGGPDWYHLWFVVYLSLITAAALGTRPLLRAGARAARASLAGRRRVRRPGADALLRTGGALAIAVQAVPTRAFAAWAVPGVDVRLLGSCAVFFAAGVGLARINSGLGAVETGRRRAAILAAVFGLLVGALGAARVTGVVLLPLVSAGGRTVELDEWALRLASGAGSWCGALAVLGYGFHYVRRSSHAVEYLRDAAYAVYLLHQALLAWIVRALGGWQAPPVVEFVVLVVLTAAATLAVYEYAIRRTPVGRVLFGLPVRVAAQRPPIGAALERLSRGAGALARPARTSI